MGRYFSQWGSEALGYRSYYGDYNGSTASRTAFETDIVAFRDRLRTELMPGASNANWVVSDIARWQGSDSNKWGYAFIVRHMNGASVATGREYMFTYGLSSNGNECYVYQFLQTEAIAEGYYHALSDNSYNMAGERRTWYIWSSPTSGLDGGGNTPGTDALGFGFNDFNAATYTSGDFVSPEASGGTGGVRPHANLDSFMNSAAHHTPANLLGFSADITMDFVEHWSVFFDDDVNGDGISASRKSCMMWLCTYGREHLRRIQTVICGDIITPLEAADTHTDGWLFGLFRHDEDEQGDTEFYRMQGRYANGDRTTFTIYQHGTTSEPFFRKSNSPRQSDDLVPWNRILVMNSSYVKGWLNTNILRQMGPFSYEGYRIYSGPQGPFIKLGEGQVYPWKTLEGPWPPIRYNI